MAQTYLDFTSYFPAIDTNEASALVTQLEATPGFEDIWAFARSTREVVGRELQNFTQGHFKEFWTTLAKESGILVSAFTPADPANPTPEEQVLIDKLVPGLFALFPTSKQSALRLAIESYRAKNFNDWQLLDAVSKATDTDARTRQGDPFFEALAGYYLTTVAQFIAARSVTYRFLGRVLNTSDASKPKAKVKVSCEDTHFVSTVRRFGSTTTNREGYYRISFTVLNGTSTPYPLSFTFSHSELGSPQVVTLNYDPADPRTPVVSSFAFTPAASTSKTIASTGVTVPADVQAYLTSQSITITRLEDIRRLGSLKNLPSDTINKSNPNLLKLDGLASLELVQDDVAKNNTLYTRGYSSVTDIALEARSAFVDENNDLFGDYGTAGIHYTAKAAHLYGVNSLAAAIAPEARHNGDGAVGGASACDCPDCKSGVSPLAYLADLISFATHNVLQGDPESAVTLGYLMGRFHQNFSGMRVSCAQLKEKLCQNRIATEVLRSYYDDLPGSPNAATLEADEKRYLMQTYELLLNKLGTSYAELRTIRGTIDPKAKQRLADRLGIVLDDGAETLEQLLIDLSDADNIVEGQSGAPPIKGLETLFGLRDSNRFVLSATPQGKVEQWKKARLRADWEMEDGLRNTFWQTSAVDREVVIDPDVVTADDLRDPTQPNGAFVIWRKRREWIDEEWSALDDETIPAVAKDFFKDSNVIIAHGATMLPATTLVYTPQGGSALPAFTIEDQFSANGNTYFRVAGTIAEDKQNGAILTDSAPPQSHDNDPLAAPPNPVVRVRNCEEMINRLCDGQTTAYSGAVAQPNWPSDAQGLVSTLRPLLPLATTGDTAALAALQQLALDLPSALRLIQVYDKNSADRENYQADGGLTHDEWAEFKNILVQVLKRVLSAPNGVWRTEESAALLSPLFFRPAISEPREGNFPFLEKGQPLIDPDLTSAADLPEITVLSNHDVTTAPDQHALELLEARKDELVADREALIAEHATGYQELLDEAFGDPGLVWNGSNPELNEYLILLNRFADAAWKDWADLFTSKRLRITEEELRAIVTLGAKEAADGELPAGEKDGLYRILLRAHKHIVHHASTNSWITDEGATAQWKMRKAMLPKWRASRAQRGAWLDALAENSARPIIDADLIGPGDMRLPESTDAAFILFDQRWKDMHGNIAFPSELGTGGWLKTIGANSFFTAGNQTETKFNLLTKEYLGHVEEGLATIRVQQETGTDIRPRIAQLTTTPAEFNQLMSYRDIILAVPNSLTTEEQTTIKRILATVQKRRKFYAYRLDEIEDGITHSQDHFRIREQALATFPPAPDRPLDTWLAEERDLIFWRRKLRGRIDQEQSVLETWHEALFAVDEAMVVHLRDALVRACGDSNKTLIENARALGDKLLIDLENNCCYKTNRVAAAIETVQQFLWKTRTGDILANYPTVRYQGDDFDEAWTWMGSYANWRAAMFVFLYPENVLHPSLRKDQTPAFREVVAATRNNRRFGPENACDVAHAFKDYLKDVSNLELKCSVEASTFYAADECGAGSQYRRMAFVFAQCRENQRTYLSLVSTENREAMKQHRYWEVVPNLGDNVHVFGCDVYHPNSGKEKYVYLFYTRNDPDEPSIFYALRFNLVDGRWEDEPLEFEVEQDALYIVKQTPAQEYTDFKKEDFSTEIIAAAVRRIDVPWRPPMVAISLMKAAGQAKDAYTFYWTMHDNGREFKARWTNDGWQLIIAGDVTFRGRVKQYLGLAVGQDLEYDDYNHSVFVLNKGIGQQHTSAWNDWNAILQQYYDWYTQIEQSGENPVQIAFGLYGTQQLIDAHLLQEPIPAYEGADGLAVDVVLRLHVGGLGSEGHDLQVAFTDLDPAAVEYAFPLNNNSALGIVRRSFSTTTTYLLDRDGTETEIENFLAPNEPIFLSSTAMEAQPVSNDPATGLQVHQPMNGWTDIRIGNASHLAWSGDEAAYDLVSGSSQRLTPRMSTLPTMRPFSSGSERDVHEALGEEHLMANTGAGLWNEQLTWEAYYFVPLQIALQLQTNGYYQDALDWFRLAYDFRDKLPRRKVWYGLRQEEALITDPHRLADWYADPLNPHAIAATRRHTYTRYTILAIVYCLLDYADAEFTTDNSETVPRARELYEDALALMQLLVPPHDCAIDDATSLVAEYALPKSWAATWTETLERLEPLTKTAGYGALLTNIGNVMGNSDPIAEQLADVNDLIDAALAAHAPATLEEVLDGHEVQMAAATAAALGSLEADEAIQQLIQQSAVAFDHTMAAVTGLPKADLTSETIAWLIDDRAPSGFDHGYAKEYISPGKEHVIQELAEGHPAQGFLLNNPFPNVWLSGVPFSFCVVPNPIAGALVMKAEVELFKIHNCMNIAGMVRELDPFAAATDSTTGIPVIGAGGGNIALPNAREIPPSAYRYRSIVERARQLVAMAQQVEAAFLATLEKLDAERYSQLRAEQDIETSKANVKLQDLKVTEAKSGVRLAELQRDRANLQVTGLQGMIDEGLLGVEELMIANYLIASAAELIALFWESAKEIAANTTSAASASVGIGVANVSNTVFIGAALAGRGFRATAMAANTANQIASIYASFERRKQEWEFQKTLAQQDVKIGEQGVKIANDRVRIVGQERVIAVLQNEHARATLDFLKNKFTSAELYEWMSKVLEDAYAWFLQEATAMAVLAQRQLAFERQLDLPPFIRNDYWIVDGGSTGGVSLTGEGAVDRRGITGSTRLLKDLTELDQYAFSTNSPKLQLTKTLSLNEIAPEQLIRLRDMGIASFTTTQDMFDRDYPGHYLRLIKKVSVTVIALTPPTKGIRATLTNGGVSSVVTGGTIFQERSISRYPEQIALSGGVGDYGVFQLQGEGEFLHPFEGTGVQTGWEFRMEKAANPFDYGSIADVLITIEYEALSNFLYRNTVVQRLNPESAAAALAISLKNNLPDQWFDLHNPVEPSAHHMITFQINQRDLAPNISAPYNITRAIAYAVMKDGSTFDYGILLGRSAPQPGSVDYQQLSADGIAILGVGPNNGPGPMGMWYLSLGPLTGTSLPLDPFANDLVEDIILVLTYDGEGTDYML